MAYDSSQFSFHDDNNGDEILNASVERLLVVSGVQISVFFKKSTLNHAIQICCVLQSLLCCFYVLRFLVFTH